MSPRYCLLVAALVLALPVQAQEAWVYRPELTIGFARVDSAASPYKIAWADTGTLWVISSAEDSLYTTIFKNALYRAELGDTTFTKVDDYADMEVRAPNGVAVHNGNVYVSSRVKNPDPYFAASMILQYPEGDVSQRQAYTSASSGSDYGSWITGIAASDDGYLVAGRSYLVTLVAFDFRAAATTVGLNVGAAASGEDPMEPGGNFDGFGSDIIRDVAIAPDNTTIYTSRNSTMYEGHASGPRTGTGGIAVWTGGTPSDPAPYRAVRLTDPGNGLALGGTHPYGITVDADGRLWVAGTDDDRRWVKAFEVVGSQAFEVDALPSQSTAVPGEDDPDGAPFLAPADVVIRPDGQVAVVIDRRRGAAFVFTRGQISVAAAPGEAPAGVVLEPPMPNPVTTEALLRYRLPAPGPVRLALYNALGQQVALLADGVRPAGPGAVRFDARALPSGVYLYRLDVAGQSRTRLLHVAH